MRTVLAIYLRALKLLMPEAQLAWTLAIAGAAIAIVQLAEPVLFGLVVDNIANARSVRWTIAAWAALGLVGVLAGVGVAVFADRLAHRMRLAVMTHAFEQAIALPVAYHAQRGSGAIVGAIQRGSDELFWLWLGCLREQLSALLGVALLLPLALYLNPIMALILIALALIYLAVNIFVIGKTSRGQAEVESLRYAVNGRVGDVISNVSLVQSYARLTSEAAAMREMANRLLSAQYPVLTWWGVLTVLQRTAATIAMIAIFTAGSYLAAQGTLTVGEIVSFIAFANLLIGKLDHISAFVVRTQQAAPALQTFFALVDEHETGSHAVQRAQHTPAKFAQRPRGDIGFDNVTLQFSEGPQGVFELSFKARAGETIAIAGRTGAGKTTALSLLLRLHEPDTGRILIDGTDIATLDIHDLRHAIAVVFQDAMLFNRSIRDNLLIGRPDASPEDIERAAQIAQAHDFIMQKPGGYDFVIGEGGAALSGGERQRLAIARAVLKDAPILILDEATSALDTQTERRIKDALDKLRAGRTTLVIAHRLSTVADADRIIVLDNGRLVEQGRYDELVKRNGLFSKLITTGEFWSAADGASASEF